MYKLSILVLLVSAGYISAGFLKSGSYGYPYGLSSPLVSSGYSGLVGGSYYQSAPAATYFSQVAPAATYYSQGAPTTSYVSSGAFLPATVENVFEERARVEPGQEFVYKVQAPPKVHKEVVQVAQVVQKPKVLYSEVVAEPKVERVTVVEEPKPQLVNVQPQIHKESLVLVQEKAKPQIYVAQKRRDTVAKKTEYEQHKFQTVHGNNGENQAVLFNQAPVYGNTGYFASAPQLVGGSTSYLPLQGAPQLVGGSTSYLPVHGASSLFPLSGTSAVYSTNGNYNGAQGTLLSSSNNAGLNEYKNVGLNENRPNSVTYTQTGPGTSKSVTYEGGNAGYPSTSSSSSFSSLSGTKN